jgi:hypothetical protein
MRSVTPLLRLFLPVLLACAPFSIGAADSPSMPAPADLVLVRQGSMPIILTAPHGGRLAIPGVAERVADKPGRRTTGGYASFKAGTDANTDILVQKIAAEIRTITGKSPYLVMAKFQRKFIDVNRPPDVGLDDPKAQPYYDYYHAAIRRFVDEVRAGYPAAILIDVHGQSDMPGVIMRGTHNGDSVQGLLKQGGFDAITGHDGIFGRLEANGFKVFPKNSVPTRGNFENAGLNGGYTVGAYSIDTPQGINAIQTEFGADYRQQPVLDKTGRDAGRAFAEFYEAYLKSPGGK